MADSFYTAWAEIAPDFSGFGRKVDKGFRDSMAPAGERAGKDAGRGMSSGVLGAVKTLAAPLAAAFGALSIGRLIGDSISQASDLQEAGTAIGEVFGDQASAIKDFAKQGATAFGETEINVLRAAQSFGIYGKAAGLAGGDLTAFSTDLVGLGTDLASFFNTDTQTAIDAIGAGLRGEAEPLRQFGVLLDDATLKARAMELGIYSGTGSLTQQQRVLAAQAEILAQTGTAQGDFARTSGGLANQQRILAAGWTNLVTTLGTLFLPMATTIVSFLNTNVIPALQNFATALSEGGLIGVLESLAAARGDFFSAIMAALPGLLQGLVAYIPQLVTFITGTMIPQVVGELLTIVGVLATALTTVIPQLVTSLAAILPSIVAQLLSMIPVLLRTALLLFQQIITALITVIPQIVTTLIGILPHLVTTILQMLPMIVEAAIALFTGLVQGIVEILPVLIQTLLGEVLPNLLVTLLGMLPDIIVAAIDLFFGLVMALLEILPQLIKTLLGDVLPNLVVTIIKMLPEIIKAAVQVFKGLLTGLTENLPEILKFIVTDMIPAIVEAIIDAVPELLEAGVALIQGLIDGVMSMLGAVGDAFGGVMDFIGGFFPRSPAKRGPFSGQGWTDLKKSGGALYDQFMDGFGGDDPEFPPIGPPRPPTIARPAGLDDVQGANAGGDGAGGDVYNLYGITTRETAAQLGDLISERKRHKIRRSTSVRKMRG